MLEISWIELLVILALALVVLGPSRLPEVARSLGLWVGRLRRMYNSFKLEIDREVGMDDIRRQLHNEQIMAEMKAVERDANTILSDTRSTLADTIQTAKNPPSDKPSLTESTDQQDGKADRSS